MEVFPHLNPIIVPIFELHVGFGVLELAAAHKLSCQGKRAPCTLSVEHYYIVLLVPLVPFVHNLKMCERQRMKK